MVRLFSPRLWERVNEHFRATPGLYFDAPRPRAYARKQRRMYEAFPREEEPLRQAAYLAKNLVNLQRFPDANKRTASVLLEVFLETNGYELSCSDEEYARFLLHAQRDVPTEFWDGRTFTLKEEYIPWREDAYHGSLQSWFSANAVRKS